MDVCVVGAGYVGLVTSACLAYFGHRVVAVDSSKSRVSQLNLGEVPFYEPGLKELIASLAEREASLEFTDNLESAVRGADVVFIAVGTPASANGEPDLSQVMTVARAVGSALDKSRRRLIVNKSTVPVGSGNWVEMLVEQGLKIVRTVPARSMQQDVPSFAVVSNPEFLREGSAIADTLYPDRIVVGSGDEEAIETMKLLYKPILTQEFEPPAMAPRPVGFSTVPFVVTDLASAEMIKYSANAFLAMKISFANEIACLCEKVGADIVQVMRGIGFDKRIGAGFLNAGIGWGGSCFAKDVSALIQVAHEYNCPTSLLDATTTVNYRQRMVAVTKLQEELKIIKGRTIGLLGLSFKPNTDDLRDAPSLSIAAHLIRMGAEVKVYDPVSMDLCASIHPQLELVYCESIMDLATGCDALVLITEWEHFLKVKWAEVASVMRRPFIVDGRNFLPAVDLNKAGFIYRGIGR